MKNLKKSTKMKKTKKNIKKSKNTKKIKKMNKIQKKYKNKKNPTMIKWKWRLLLFLLVHSPNWEVKKMEKLCF